MHLRLDLDLLGTRERLEARHVDLVVEVPDVGHDRQVLEREHVVDAHHAEVARARHDDVDLVRDVRQARHLVAVHRGLQRADRVDLADDDPCTLAAHRLGGALADVAVPDDEDDLAADQHVRGTVQAVGQRVPDAVLVVELRLGDGVVHVDRREAQFAGAEQLVQAVHARGGLLGDALDVRRDPGPAVRGRRQGRGDGVEHDPVLGARVGTGVGDPPGCLGVGAGVHEHRRVTAVVEDQVRADPGLASCCRLGRPVEDAAGAPPVLFERLALPREHGDPGGRVDGAVRPDGDGGSGLVLRGEDVAARPAHLRTERGEGLDEHRGLHRHVQRTGDACSGERLRRAELLAERHEPRHLVLGETDLVPTGRGEAEVGHAEGCGLGFGGHGVSLPRWS